jgi:hypothetical protein
LLNSAHSTFSGFHLTKNDSLNIERANEIANKIYGEDLKKPRDYLIFCLGNEILMVRKLKNTYIHYHCKEIFNFDIQKKELIQTKKVHQHILQNALMLNRMERNGVRKTLLHLLAKPKTTQDRISNTSIAMKN